MKTIERYLIVEMSKSIGAVLLVLLTLTMGNTLVSLLEKAQQGEISASFVFPLLGVSMANYLIMFLGLSSMLGIMLCLGRLYKDSEVYAMFACGMAPKNFYSPIAKIALFTTLFALWLSLWAVPWLGKQQSQLLTKAELPSIEKNLRPSEFNPVPNGVIYVQDIRNGNLYNVFIAYNAPPHKKIIQIATMGRIVQQQKQLFLELSDGILYQHDAADGGISRTKYAAFKQNIDLPTPVISNAGIEAKPTLQLLGSKNLDDIGQWQWRLATPISCLLLSLLAFPLSHSSPRKGMFAKLGYGVLVYMLYNNFLGLAKNMLEQGKIPPYIGLWSVHLALLSLIIGLSYYHYAPRKRRKKPSVNKAKSC